jgi:hypothetical protein
MHDHLLPAPAGDEGKSEFLGRKFPLSDLHVSLSTYLVSLTPCEIYRKSYRKSGRTVSIRLETFDVGARTKSST